MTTYLNLAILAGFLFVYSLYATRLERTIINGPIVYVAFGFLVGPLGLDILDFRIDGEALSVLAEITLALVLFTDSANANLAVLKRFKGIPARLLLIGLPLTILLGFIVGMGLFDQLGVFEVALLATMLAPTDAALGKAVVSNPAVPGPVSQGLNVESGLNDGICVPVLFIFIALAAGSTSEGDTTSLVLRLPLEAIGIGALIGVVFAALAVVLLKPAVVRGWISGGWLQFPVVALALLCFAVAQRLGGSGFIACFIGGLLFGKLAGERKEKVLLGAENTGEVLALLTWVSFGGIVVAQHIEHLSWAVLLYAVLSLTVIRMVPVFICLLGTSHRMDTKLFAGWFGPRGLASIVFIVIVLGEKLPGSDTLLITVSTTILLSVVFHGLSANPLVSAYSERIKARGGEI